MTAIVSGETMAQQSGTLPRDTHHGLHRLSGPVLCLQVAGDGELTGKPWENRGKTIGEWWFHWILWDLANNEPSTGIV